MVTSHWKKSMERACLVQGSWRGNEIPRASSTNGSQLSEKLLGNPKLNPPVSLALNGVFCDDGAILALSLGVATVPYLLATLQSCVLSHLYLLSSRLRIWITTRLRVTMLGGCRTIMIDHESQKAGCISASAQYGYCLLVWHPSTSFYVESCSIRNGSPL